MAGLQASTLKNVIWNFAEQFLTKGISVVTTLVLAWLLVPEDYALIAMLAVVIALSSALVDGGFGQAIIRKTEITPEELDTVFWTNIGLSIVIYGLVYLLAPAIASFYNEERLIELIRVVGIAIFFQSLIVVQEAVLSRALKFKQQVKVVLPAAILSSVSAIVLAYYEFGVWSLIYQIVINSFFLFVFYWMLKLWRPTMIFKVDALVDLWQFSKFIVIDSMVAIPFKNMYLMVLPKYFAAGPVGLYFFAEKLKKVLIGLIVNSVQKVTYPALSKIQDDHVRLKQGYRKVVATTTFLLFPMMFLLAALAPTLFELVLPEKWHGAAIYLQLMCLAALFNPLNSINLNILKVKGRSDLVFYVGIFKKIIVIALFIYTLQFGIVEIILGQIVASVINYVPNAYYSFRLIQYSIKEQLADFLPGLFLSFFITAGVYYLQELMSWPAWVELFLLSFVYLTVYLIGAYLLKLHAFELASEMIYKKFKNEK